MNDDDLKKRIADYLRANIPTDEAFWRDKDRARDHIVSLMLRKMRVDVARPDVEFDHETGVFHVRMYPPAVIWLGDNEEVIVK